MSEGQEVILFLLIIIVMFIVMGAIEGAVERYKMAHRRKLNKRVRKYNEPIEKQRFLHQLKVERRVEQIKSASARTLTQRHLNK